MGTTYKEAREARPDDQSVAACKTKEIVLLLLSAKSAGSSVNRLTMSV